MKLLTLAIILCASLAFADCEFNPVYIEGTIGAVKTDFPYPLDRPCGTWKCKVKILYTEYDDGEIEVYKYKSYPVDNGLQCVDKTGKQFDCCTLKTGAQVRAWLKSKRRSPLRGEVERIEIK